MAEVSSGVPESRSISGLVNYMIQDYSGALEMLEELATVDAEQVPTVDEVRDFLLANLSEVQAAEIESMARPTLSISQKGRSREMFGNSRADMCGRDFSQELGFEDTIDPNAAWEIAITDAVHFDDWNQRINTLDERCANFARSCPQGVTGMGFDQWLLLNEVGTLSSTDWREVKILRLTGDGIVFYAEDFQVKSCAKMSVMTGAVMHKSVVLELRKGGV